MENEVVQKGNMVSKKFASHLSFVKEESIYKKLEGTGLCPRLIYSGSGLIEHSFVSGISLKKIINSEDISKIASAFKLFFEWYVAFYKKTGNLIGKTDFQKFILTEDEKIVCVDFEHCKAGYFERDLAGFVLEIFFSNEAFSENSMQLCRLFEGIGSSYITPDAKRFNSYFTELLEMRCHQKNIEYPAKEAEYICTALNCCGVLFAEDPLADVNAALNYLSTMPQKILLCKEEGKPACPGFSYMAEENIFGVRACANLLKNIKQPWSLWLSSSELYTSESINALLSWDKKDGDVFIAASSESERIFPCLLRTQTARVVLNSYPDENLLKTLKKLKAKYIL